MKRLSILLATIFAFSLSWAIDVEDYYSSAEGKSAASLKTALHNIIKDHTDVGYKGLWSVYQTADSRDGKIWDMYSTCDWTYSTDQCGNYSNICDCYNREHMIPQSWFNERTPMKSDAFHVYPTDGKVNGMRGNHPHGETNASAIGGKGLGAVGTSSVSGYSGTVYEPIDEYKGDVARTYFYFVTRYEDQLSSFDRNDVLTGDTYPSLTSWFYNLMLEWHRQDPVSQKEIDRNEAVYAHQHNRNPFIDYPELAEHVWGDKMGEPFYVNPTTNLDNVELKYDVVVNDYVINISNLPMSDYSVELYDLSGRLIYSAQSTTSIHTFSVNKQGVYILRIGTIATKIIVQ